MLRSNATKLARFISKKGKRLNSNASPTKAAPSIPAFSGITPSRKIFRGIHAHCSGVLLFPRRGCPDSLYELASFISPEETGLKPVDNPRINASTEKTGELNDDSSPAPR